MNSGIDQVKKKRKRVVLPLVVSIVLFVFALSGQAGAGLGYGLLLVCAVSLLGSVLSLALLVLTRSFSTNSLIGATRWLFWLGAWSYVIGVFALSGFYVHEAMAGQVEMKWILFGPTAVLVLILFDIGIYRLLVHKNKATWARYRQHISRDRLQPEKMRNVLLTDVILHTNLFAASSFRWLRHTLIYWGFAMMFAVEILAVFVREGMPAFGLADIWEETHHPVRLAFDFAFDVFGFMVLLGCLLAFIWRINVAQKPEKKFADTPSAIFLFLVVATGFVVEALRISQAGIPDGSGYSFVGWILASAIPQHSAPAMNVYTAFWYIHVFGSLAFIVYVPAHRLAHSCATPIGRLMTSQTAMLTRKKLHSIKGLMSKPSGSTVTRVEIDT